MKVIFYFIAIILLFDGVLGIVLSTESARNGDLSRLDYFALTYGIIKIMFAFVLGIFFRPRGKD